MVNDGNYQIWLEEGGILVIQLVGDIKNRVAFNLEKSIFNYTSKFNGIEHIVFRMDQTSSLSSKAMTILLDYYRKDGTIYYKIPGSIKKQFYNIDILRRFESKEYVTDDFEELIDSLRKHVERRADGGMGDD